MDASLRGSLLSFLAEVPDPRSRHGRRHPLSAILALVCCAIMSGAKSYCGDRPMGPGPGHRADAPARLHAHAPEGGGDPQGPDRPGRDGLRGRVDPVGRGEPEPTDPARARALEAFALDGKSVRGSFDGWEHAVHRLSLMAHNSGLTLAQAAVPHGVEDKTNEHKTALRLLEGVDLKGRVVTGDALFCQRDLSQQVIDAQGHFLWFVKENQPTLLQDIEAAFAPSVEGAFSPSAAAVLGGGDGDRDDAR